MAALKYLKPIIFVLSIGLLAPAYAIDFKKDSPLENGAVFKLRDIKKSEIHADATLTNRWLHGISGSNNDYESIFEYRTEGHLPLFHIKGHSGKLITRIEGVGIIDEIRNQFLEDPLIDIPEILFEDNFKNNKIHGFFAAGRLANRRYMNRNDITPDQFDIGERRFLIAQSNTLNLLNSINEGRNKQFMTNRQATGSYGFAFGIHDSTGNKLFDRFGFRQVLGTAELSNFTNNFYGISEIVKNWDLNINGSKVPGQFNLGAAYGRNGAFRQGNNTSTGENNYNSILYFSIVQKINKMIRIYSRYGTQFFDDENGRAINRNEIKGGIYFSLGKKQSFSTHVNYFDSNGFSENGGMIIVHSYKYKFTPNFATNVYFVHQWNMPNSNASNGLDSRWNTGFHFQFKI